VSLVIALAGRRIDEPGCEDPAFPAASAALVRDRLRSVLLKHEASALICSAACGADLIALEVAGELGIRRCVVLPFPRAHFRTVSVGADWAERFDRVLDEVEAAGDVMVTGSAQPHAAAFREVNITILNEAAALARNLRDGMAAIVVWEGKSRRADDMSLHFLQEAKQRGIPVHEVLTAGGDVR
jgi:hypothetical protein